MRTSPPLHRSIFTNFVWIWEHYDSLRIWNRNLLCPTSIFYLRATPTLFICVTMYKKNLILSKLVTLYYISQFYHNAHLIIMRYFCFKNDHYKKIY